ncbi:uncharacterized protein LOC122625504 [Drosophila teissieri]|uniref:uncharacterized protein LOC122625504 n=1 Tax=Drosophila teissieri TaxID=7243 RepID=UPI001CBA243C|nr:uncharacterized protein LOC122625504 [Drosophila teissieri]
MRSDATISPTKRELLSQLSRIYDPLGLVAPVTVLLKLIFQESWTSVLQWDDPIPESLRTRWRALVEDLPALTQCQVPRYIASPFRDVQLHGFADASSHAYGALVYARVAVGCSFQVTLVAAKTRVAPIKPVSIPHLELNAIVETSLTIPLFSTSCWTDSEIVLHWLSAPPRRWNTYVCNRTSEILSDFPRSCWNHVRTEDNPADCASRGLHPSKLLEHRLWNSAPFLTSEELLDAQRRLIRHVQQKSFAREYAQLESRRQLNAKSHLIRFSPFLDDYGVMRVGGRIEQSTLNYNAKHPILIPKDTPLAGLLVRHFHVSYLHTGVDATFTNLRQQYWILGARNLVLYIEVVSELTTQAFIAAFQRFIARRAKPTDLYSDNGTTFHGGKQTLDDMRRLAIQQAKDEECKSIDWRGGISCKPWFKAFGKGGIWNT